MGKVTKQNVLVNYTLLDKVNYVLSHPELAIRLMHFKSILCTSCIINKPNPDSQIYFGRFSISLV